MQDLPVLQKTAVRNWSKNPLNDNTITGVFTNSTAFNYDLLRERERKREREREREQSSLTVLVGHCLAPICLDATEHRKLCNKKSWTFCTWSKKLNLINHQGSWISDMINVWESEIAYFRNLIKLSFSAFHQFVLGKLDLLAAILQCSTLKEACQYSFAWWSCYHSNCKVFW